MSLLERVVVTYWKIPGGGLAAPAVMLCYYVGQQVFEEYMDKERWETYKKTTPWGQLPIYTLEYRRGTLQDSEDDKVVFSNSVPTLRALGRVFGMYFTELKQNQRYQTDVWIDAGVDCMRTLYPSMKLKGDDRLNVRSELISEGGKLHNWFERFDAKVKTVLGDSDEIKFLVDNTISIADFHFFATINSIVCGWIDGVDKSFLEKFTSLNSWYTKFLKHYQERLESNPKKDEYPYIVHNGRYYVMGKDETEFWANKDNHMSEEEVSKMEFRGVGYEDKSKNDSNVETHNVKMTQEQMEKMGLDIKNEVKKEVNDVVLTKESTLGEVEGASVKLLKNTLKKHGKSYAGVTEKHELIKMVKDVLVNNAIEENTETAQ